MNPNQLSFGSGSALLGASGGDLQAAISRRQTGEAGVTAQQSPASAGFNPAAMAPTPPTGGPAPMATGSPSAAPTTTASGVGNPEARIILQALSGRLKSISDLEKSSGGGINAGSQY